MNFVKFFETCNINHREVLKNLPDAVFVVESDGRISWVNSKAIKMFKCFEKDLLEIFFDEVVVNGFDLIEEAFFKRKNIVTGAIAIDGSEFFVEISSRKYAEQYFVTLRNVTQMTNVFADVEKTGKINKEKNMMLCKLSNDFKSPLQSILGFSKALKDGLCGEVNEKQTKYLDIINNNAKNLANFTDKFINLAYAESTIFKCEYGFFDVVTVIQNLVKEFEPDLKEKKFDLNLFFDDLQKRVIYSDEKVIKSIMRDIISVAISLMGVGSLSIRLVNPELQEVEEIGAVLFDNCTKASYIKFEVRDTGVGLAESELEDLFEPYNLLDSSNKKALLRAITFCTVQKFVRKLKGEISVKSEVIRGSVYTIILPIEKDKDFEDE